MHEDAEYIFYINNKRSTVMTLGRASKPFAFLGLDLSVTSYKYNSYIYTGRLIFSPENSNLAELLSRQNRLPLKY